jgi:hypothetical protein
MLTLAHIELMFVRTGDGNFDTSLDRQLVMTEFANNPDTRMWLSIALDLALPLLEFVSGDHAHNQEIATRWYGLLYSAALKIDQAPTIDLTKPEQRRRHRRRAYVM